MLVYVNANKISVWPFTEACVTRERAMPGRPPAGRIAHARTRAQAAHRVSANNPAPYAGAWNARTLAGRPTGSATRTRPGWRAPLPARPAGTSWTRAPPPGCTCSCGPSRDGRPAVRSRWSCREGSSFHLIGHTCRGPDRSARSRAFTRVGDPDPSALTDIRLARIDRTVSWLLGLAKLGPVRR